ncbi:MAG: carbohydrate ABC transporter permease [Treponema sp.]|jgi:putative aldouronate transport system permease protein|nr:carbohydrate ABC transporter permease [Treponema sp.]
MKKGTSRYIFEIVNYLFMIGMCVVMLYPFLFVLAASLSSSSEVSRGMVGIIPKGFNIRAYEAVFKYEHIWTGYRNTILYTTCGTIVNLALTICGAYPLSRKQFVGRSAFTFFIAVTMFFSGGLIPTYLVMRHYKLLNTFWVMILPGAISTWNMIIMRTFFQNLPSELEESAIIDGCNDLGVLMRIVIPLSTASIMTIGMFYAVGHWNAWFDAFIYLRDHTRYPIQLWLRTIVLQNQMNDITNLQGAVDVGVENLISDTIKYAVIVVAAAPILCVYPFIQKYFVKGVMVGSIKG